MTPPSGTPSPSAPSSLEERVRAGDREALAELLAGQRAELRRYVEYRLDPRLRGRLSASDVLQEIYLSAQQRLEHFRELVDMPFRVWVRLLASQRLVDVHRKHMSAQARDAGIERSLDQPFRGAGAAVGSSASAVNLAARIVDDQTSPSQVALRRELLDQLVEAIGAMDPLDREVLALRHFDELTNDEVARLLDIPKGTASKRYIRALGRLRAMLERVPGLIDPSHESP